MAALIETGQTRPWKIKIDHFRIDTSEGEGDVF